MLEANSQTFLSIPDVEIEYSIDKYLDVLEPWSGTKLKYLERHFSIYDAIAKPGSKFGDQMIYQSPCSISLILLSPNHPFFNICVPIKENIEKIQFCLDSLISDNPASGKRKKGAACLEPGTEVAVIKVYLKQVDASISSADQKPDFSFPICACLQGAMVEMNQKVINDPFILFDEFEKEAYLGIMLPKFEKIPIESSVHDPKDAEAHLAEFISDPSSLKIENPTKIEQNSESKDVTQENQPKKARNSKRSRKIASSLARCAIDPNSPLIYLRSSRLALD